MTITPTDFTTTDRPALGAQATKHAAEPTAFRPTTPLNDTYRLSVRATAGPDLAKGDW